MSGTARVPFAGGRIGDYQILGLVGAGGMGAVYKALDLKLERMVALKFLSHDLSIGEKEKERFLREAKSASALDHTNIGVIHGLEESEDGQLFIVMAYYDGETLAERIRRGPLPESGALDIAIQMARGMAEAHARHIVHRDIKPSNVMITSQNVVKIVDFGLARVLSTPSATQSLGLAGTVAYMSPEQALGEPVDERSDIWAWGVVLAQMLSGRHPFQRDSIPSVMSAIMNQPPAMNGVPARWQPIIYRALSKDAANRYQNCSELLSDLQALKADDAAPTQSVVPKVFDEYVKHASGSSGAASLPRQTSRWWLAAAAMVLLLVVALLFLPSIRQRLMHIAITPEMLRDTGGSVTPAAYESYLKALGYLHRYDKPGNLDSAISLLDNATKADPQFALAFAGLGEAYWLKYRLDQNPKWIDVASANCKRAAELNDRLPAVYVTLGRIHDGTGKHDLAVQEFQHALALHPRNADALLGMARVYESVARFADAESTFKEAAALRPDYWDGYSTLGLFYLRRQRYEDARAQFRHVLELTPDNAQTYANLGIVYLNLQKPAEAENAFKKSIELSPGYAAYANLGFLYYQQNRYAESAAMTEKALQINDKDYRLWANLGLAYRWLQDDEKARAAAERELKLLEAISKVQSEDPYIQSELGYLYALAKQRDNAIRRFEAALALAPDNPRILADVGEGYEYLGDRRRALQHIKKALRKGFSLDDLKRVPGMQNLISDPNFRPAVK